MASLDQLAIAVVQRHPAVVRVALAGSRARGTDHALSDWDFAVETGDFPAVARALPTLVAPLAPLTAQWEPLGPFPAYMLLLRGPTKVEYLFLEESQEAKAPLRPHAETLCAIDAHFWDWIWWLGTQASVGRSVAEHWARLHHHLLAPMGVASVPDSVEAATREFLRRRQALEDHFGLRVPNGAEREVRSGLRRLGYRV